MTLPVVGGTALSYGEMAVTDATGRTLDASLNVSHRQIVLDVNDADAVYPLHIDPLLQEANKLTANDSITGAGFGYSVALSSDGGVALIGGPGDNGYTGAAWMFTRTGTTWTPRRAANSPAIQCWPVGGWFRCLKVWRCQPTAIRL